MTSRTIRLKTLATVTVGLLALTACGSGTDSPSTAGTGTGGATAPITLKLATFNHFGYDELLKEYEAANPNVTIEHNKAATSNDARDNLNTRLAAGSGLSDVEAVEVDWLPELMQYSDKLADLRARRRRGPLARLEGEGRDRRRRPPHRLRHRHRPRRRSATAPTCSRPPACRPTATRSPRCSAATGTVLRGRRAVRRQLGKARGSTPPAPRTRA